MISSDQVILAYRLFLGREPESQAVINELCQTIHSISALRDVFMSSAEFRQRMGKVLDKFQNVQLRHPFHLPYIPVEVEMSETLLSKMFDRIKYEWNYLGKIEPYWSTITQPQYHFENFEANRKIFYDSGKYMLDIFLSALRRNNINPNFIQTCFELGCGVGRVTQYLAKSFPRLIASDISYPHLMIGKAQLESQGLKNTEFLHIDDPISFSKLPNVDSIFSVITLQHNPPPMMVWILKKLLSCLNKDGIAYIQIPTYRNGYLFEVERYLKIPQPNTLEMHFLPQKEIFRVINESNCICLEMREDSMVGDEVEMLSNSFLIKKYR